MSRSDVFEGQHQRQEASSQPECNGVAVAGYSSETTSRSASVVDKRRSDDYVIVDNNATLIVGNADEVDAQINDVRFNLHII